MTRNVPMSGRRAQAARNDGQILDAAREVFTADPAAPIAAVAARAGVGMSALYRRYRSKEDLLRHLCLDGLQRYITEAEAALDAQDDPWSAFAAFMHRCLEAGAGSLTLRFAGAFTADEELHRLGRAAQQVTQRLLDRTAASGALRPGIAVGDLSLLFEQLQAVRVADPARSGQLRRRYLALLLDALHTPSAAPLPGPAPEWEEISSRYSR